MKKLLLRLIFLVLTLPVVAQNSPDWSVNPSQYQYSMTMVASVKLGNVVSTDQNDRVGVFVGEELRGTGFLNVSVPSNDTYVAFVQVYSNQVSGEALSFKIYDASEDLVVSAVNTETFEDSKQLGENLNPFEITDNHEITDITLSISSVDENAPSGSISATLGHDDQDENQTYTFSLVSGTGDDDNDDFSISEDQLTLTVSYDYESTQEVSIRVKVVDSKNASYEEQITLTVNDLNDAPSEIDLDNNSVDENAAKGTLIGSFTTTDQDVEDTHTYTLVSGSGDTDNGLFQVSGSDLEVKGSLDFESGSSLLVRVRSTDEAGETVERIFTVELNDVNDAPTGFSLSNQSVPENENTSVLVGTLSTTDPDDNDTHKYSLVSGTGSDDNDLFVIRNANELQTAATFNFEEKSTYSIRLATTDAEGASFEESFTISITDTNDAPSQILLSNNSIVENGNADDLVGVLSATDEDVSDSHTFSLVSGDGDGGNDLFNIDGSQLLAVSGFNYEITAHYSVRVKVVDSEGDDYEKVFSINIQDANDRPTGIQLDNSSLPENSGSDYEVASLTAIDEDVADSHEFSLVTGDGDEDNSSFSISGSKLITAGDFDYEEKSTYNIRLRATDDAGSSFELSQQLVITNVNEAPTALTLSKSSLAENNEAGQVIGTFNVTDPDQGDSFSLQLVSGIGGDDNAVFEIMNTRELVASEQFDFETKSSFSIRLRATDNGGLSLEKVFELTVTDANDAPTDIDLSASQVSENQVSGTVVGVFSSTDQDQGDIHSYALIQGTGGKDNALFSINESGELVTSSVLNFEESATRSIRVIVRDQAGAAKEKVFQVSINDLNDEPTGISLSNREILENLPVGSLVGSLQVTDEDIEDTHTLSFESGEGGSGNGSFQIIGTDLLTNEVFDYESKKVFSVRIKATDQAGSSVSRIFEINIGNDNDQPTALTLSANVINENKAEQTLIGQLTVMDQDADASYSYEFVSGNGDTHNDRFQIVDSELRSAETYDYEELSEMSVRVRATESQGDQLESVFIIKVEDVNDAPTDIDLSASQVSENQTSGTVVGSFSSTDQDQEDTHTYALIQGAGGTDNALFSINENGKLVTNAVLNFEESATRSIRVIVRDQAGAAKEKVFQVTIKDLNDEPTSISLSNKTILENQAAGSFVGSLQAQDEDTGDTHVFSLEPGVGDSGNGFFQISGTDLVTKEEFDYEKQNAFSIRLKVTDASGATFVTVLEVQVVNDNDEPTELALSGNVIDENKPAQTVIGEFTITDEDSDDIYAYALVAGDGDTHNDRFEIVDGELRSLEVYNHEELSEMSIRVRATEAQGDRLESVFIIRVEDVNDLPTDIKLSVSQVSENQVSGTIVGAFSSTDQDENDTHTYALIQGQGGSDNALFNIDENGQLTTATVLNFEESATRSVRVIVRDAAGAATEKIFTISITDLNDAPANISLSNDLILENQATGSLVGILQALDEDTGDTHTFSLEPGEGDSGNSSFQINGADLLTNQLFNYESKKVYSIRIKVTDQSGSTVSNLFEINIGNDNDLPTALTLSANMIDENETEQALVGEFTTIDEDADASYSYEFVSGDGDTDNGRFEIIDNELRSAETYDYEELSQMSVRVRATEAQGDQLESVFIIRVEDVNDAPTDIGLSTSQISENQVSGTIVGTLSSTDQDESDTHTYALIQGEGGTDNALFSIDESGQLITAAELNFEESATRSIRVIVRDAAGAATEKVFLISVEDLNDEPTSISLSDDMILENQVTGSLIGILQALDEDTEDTHTFSLESGEGDSGNSSFQINGTDLLTNKIFDYESQKVYSIRIKTADPSGASVSSVLQVNIANDNDQPTALTLSANAINENEAIQTLIGEFVTVDEDADASYTYELVSGDGDTHNARFEIVDNELRSTEAYNHEELSELFIRVRATEGGGDQIESVFTILIEDVNEDPTSFTLSGNSVAENSPGGTLVGTMSLIDEDENESYDFVLKTSHADNAFFGINGGNQLVVAGALNFEEKNAFNVRIEAIDSEGRRFEKAFDITITNVPEPGIDPSAAEFDFGEVGVGQTESRQLIITNTGPDGVLNISEIQLPTGFSIDPATSTVNPGESEEFTLSFEPTEAGQVEEVMTIISNAGEVQISLFGVANVVTGIDDLPELSDLVSVYPNPVLDKVTIDLGPFAKPHVQISVSDASGNQLRVTSVNGLTGELELDISYLPGGMYFLLLSDGEQIARKKILKR